MGKSAHVITLFSQIGCIGHFTLNWRTLVTLLLYLFTLHFRLILMILIVLFLTFFLNFLRHFHLRTFTNLLLIRFCSFQLKFFYQKTYSKNKNWQEMTNVSKNATIR